jgi:hypothetical protein
MCFDNSKVLAFVLLYSVGLYVKKIYAFLPFFRIINFWFLAPFYQREDNSRLILLLVTLKPPRLMRAKKEMMP